MYNSKLPQVKLELMKGDVKVLITYLIKIIIIVKDDSKIVLNSIIFIKNKKVKWDLESCPKEK